MDISILSQYTFQVVAVGTIFLGLAAGAVGAIPVLKGQSLIGDAIGHSSYLGIVGIFMIIQTRNPAILALGSFISGSLAFFCIQTIGQHKKIEMNNALAFVLSSFFGMGMVLKSYIQGHPSYQEVSQAGLQNYIFGQASYIMKDDTLLIMIVAALALMMLIVFFKEFKIYIFDEVYAKTVGISAKYLRWITLIMCMLLISVGLKAVGAILISSMLIVPTIAALQWTDDFGHVLGIAAFVGGFSAFFGTYLSSTIHNMPTGPAITVVMCSMCFLSILFGPKGLVSNKIKQRGGE
ncbi:metal ABC transporter permease [Allofustis seminis]|uniref:metal ABC transporter permease n=1 Tax=Allofustis seminis TaxID=166939 RepID=UPI00036CAF13|nr:iron chelate uptake ABC transporter family permease subunit [Allofustis seminis]